MSPAFPALQFRRAGAGDLGRLFEIETAAHPFPWTEGQLRDCFKAGYELWLASGSDQADDPATILGYAVIARVLDEASLLNLCVSPEQQGAGVGGSLLDFLLQFDWEPPVRRWFLEVRVSNARAIALYVKRGFRQVGWRKAYYPTEGGKEDALVLAREPGPL